MIEKKIAFTPSQSEKDLGDIYNFNVTAFADIQDFSWTKENIKKEIKNGWLLYSVKIDNDVVCALFIKTDGKKLLTKNTPLKMNYQGRGFSHMIKEFYEQYAREHKISQVYNYCPADNFRMISLNEGHDYEKTGIVSGDNDNIIEWIKKI